MTSATIKLFLPREDINRVQTDVEYGFVYVDEESFEKYKPSSFRQLLEAFKEYKEKM